MFNKLSFLKIANIQIKDFLPKKTIDAHHEIKEFLRFKSMYLEYDHPTSSFNSSIKDFTDKFIKTNLINPNIKITGNFDYFFNYNDTWTKYNITKRFQKKTTIRFENASLLHVACTIGNAYLINELLDQGLSKNLKDSNNLTPQQFLRFNPNHMTKDEYSKLVNLLNPEPQTTHRAMP